MKSNIVFKIAALFLFWVGIFPHVVFAAAPQPFFYAGWLPFWKKQSGANDLSFYLDKFREISPFSYEVNGDGTLRDVLKINQGFWPAWLSAARDLRVKIIPSVALLDGNAIYKLLSETKLRRKHEDIIAKSVKTENFDGIDIDYEDKSAAAEPYFSLFIKGLAMRLHPMKKTLSCTVEARTPPSSQFAVIPENLAYANNYKVFNTYCDEVRIMAYDQGNIDLKLDAQKGSSDLYMPVADVAWVKKVLDLTLKTISRKKIMLGIPTYGYDYEVSRNGGATTYKRVRSLTYDQAQNLAVSLNAVPVRNSAGELSFTYTTSTFVNVPTGLTYIITSSMAISSAAVSAPASISSATDPSLAQRLVWFSDVSAINDKINLAKKFGLRGAVFFKMDGEADPRLRDYLK